MSTRQKIMTALQEGDRTNADLQDVCDTDQADIARTICSLLSAGHIVRTNPGGSGSKAIYGLSDSARANPPKHRRSQRETEAAIAELLDEGHSVAEIAAKLSISEGWTISIVSYLGGRGFDDARASRTIRHQTGLLMKAIRAFHPDRCVL